MNFLRTKVKSINEDKRGITLIEVLIVLAIMAVIAAFAIPSMLGFVHDAEGKAYIANARTCYVAGQVIATEESAAGKTDSAIAGDISVSNSRFAALVGEEVIGSGSNKATVTATVSGGAVTSITYTMDGYTVSIVPGSAATVTKN